MESAVADRRQASRAKRYLKLVRHLLLLAQASIQRGCRVVWLMHPESKVMLLSETRHFWKVHGHGEVFWWKPTVKVIATHGMIRNTLSTTTSGVQEASRDSWIDTNGLSRNTVSTTTSGVHNQTIWQELGACMSSRLDEVYWSPVGEVHAVDTSVLQTLTSQELQKLMDSVRQQHRRFGHPSNRLLIKNLVARNADPKVIAAVS